MADFHFIRPLWLLMAIPVIICWWGLWRHHKLSQNLQSFIEPHLLKHLLVGEQKKRWFRPIHLLLVLWLLAVVAIAGPSWKQEPSPFLSDEAGLMILLKTARTMEAADVSPSRLTRAKQKISDILEARKGSATGLIVYSGSAHLVMPLTKDGQIINVMLEEMGPDVMPKEGDLLSAALALGEQMVSQSGLPGSMLVIADSVAEQSFDKGVVPVQFLSVQPVGVDADRGLDGAASALDGKLTLLTADKSDVEQVVQRAETSHLNVSEPGQSERWKDGGYLLVPFIALVMLFWFRKGWVVR